MPGAGAAGRGSFGPAQAVADAPLVGEPAGAGVDAELLAQPAGMGVERARAALRPEAPHRLEQLGLREDPAGLGGERRQELVLLGREVDLDAADRDLARERVHGQVAVADDLTVARARHPSE